MEIASITDATLGLLTFGINLKILALNKNILAEAEKVQKEATEMTEKIEE